MAEEAVDVAELIEGIVAEVDAYTPCEMTVGRLEKMLDEDRASYMDNQKIAAGCVMKAHELAVGAGDRDAALLAWYVVVLSELLRRTSLELDTVFKLLDQDQMEKLNEMAEAKQLGSVH